MTITSAVPARKVEGSSEAVIEAAEVTRTYGEGEAAVHALRGVSLEIVRHRLTAVMKATIQKIHKFSYRSQAMASRLFRASGSVMVIVRGHPTTMKCRATSRNRPRPIVIR